MAKIDSIFKKEIKKAEPHPKRITTWIHYSKLKPNKKHYRGGKSPEEKQRVREAEEALADLIEADGEVLQNLLVRKIDTDEYEIIAGHHRKGACKILVEERGRQEFALLPCSIQSGSSIRAEFTQYSSNGFAPKSDYEIMCELERMKYLLENYPEEFPNLQTGRMVERLAKQMNMTKTTVGEYQTISKNLTDKAMKEFEAGRLKKSAAVLLSSLPEQEQETLVEEGKYTLKEIREYKAEEFPKVESKDQVMEAAEENLPEMPKSKEAEAQQLIRREEKKVVKPARMEEKSAMEFPEMKNNDQRKEWLRNYQAWGVWYEDVHIGVKYYKYDFLNGARLIAEEYQEHNDYTKTDYTQSYLHLVGGPKPPKDGKYGISRWQWHKQYCRHANSETELVEFLKYVQKEK